MYNCDMSKRMSGLSYYHCKGNQWGNAIYMTLPQDVIRLMKENSKLLKETLNDKSYHDRGIYIMDLKCKEVNHFLFKPFWIYSRC